MEHSGWKTALVALVVGSSFFGILSRPKAESGGETAQTPGHIWSSNMARNSSRLSFGYDFDRQASGPQSLFFYSFAIPRDYNRPSKTQIKRQLSGIQIRLVDRHENDYGKEEGGVALFPIASIAPNVKRSRVWALNPYVQIAPGSDGQATAVEADVENNGENEPDPGSRTAKRGYLAVTKQAAANGTVAFDANSEGHTGWYEAFFSRPNAIIRNFMHLLGRAVIDRDGHAAFGTDRLDDFSTVQASGGGRETVITAERTDAATGPVAGLRLGAASSDNLVRTVASLIAHVTTNNTGAESAQLRFTTINDGENGVRGYFQRGLILGRPRNAPDDRGDGTINAQGGFFDALSVGGGKPIRTIRSIVVKAAFPEVQGDGEISELAFPMPGAALGDSVALGLPANGGPSGIGTSAFVSGPDVVTIRAINYTRKPIGPMAMTLRITVLSY